MESGRRCGERVEGVRPTDDDCFLFDVRLKIQETVLVGQPRLLFSGPSGPSPALPGPSPAQRQAIAGLRRRIARTSGWRRRRPPEAVLEGTRKA